MGSELVNANFVVVARQFNPSVVNQLWLVDNGIVSRDAFRPGCVFTDVVAHVLTDNFILFVSPEQLQFTPLADLSKHQKLAADTVGRLVTILPHTPYTAAGLNFAWRHVSGDVSIVAASRKLFFNDNRRLFHVFDTHDAKFGGYLSKDELGCRMNLDVKPMVVETNDGEVEVLQFAFNFHLHVAETRNAVTMIQGLISRWDEGQSITADIMQSLEGDV